MNELDQAIHCLKLQYESKQIKKIDDFIVENGMMAFAPTPEADESWAVGGQILFCCPNTNNGFDVVESRDIGEYDPDSGRIYFEAGSYGSEKDLEPFTLFYRPFDYAQALAEAFQRLETHLEIRDNSLRCIRGEIDDKESGIQALPSDGTKSPIGEIWSKSWSLLWGPPGTGKTENIAQSLALYVTGGSSAKVLVATPTNLAADEVALRICRILDSKGALKGRKEFPVFRGGRVIGKKLKEEYPGCLRDERYAREYDKKLKEIEKLKAKLESARKKRNFPEASETNRKIQELLATLPDETEYAATRGAARVIVLTAYRALSLVGAADNPAIFEKVVVDEAGMVSRLTAAALSTLGRTVMLAGDPKQIGPIYTLPAGTSKPIRTWLLKSGLSHLESVTESLAHSYVRFLDLQYRMHPNISKVVSHFTYDGLLKDSDRAKRIADEAPASRKLPASRAALILLDDIARRPSEVSSQKAAKGKGRERDFSAMVAIGLALAASEHGHPVLILTPYRAQVRNLRSRIRALKKVKKGTITAGTIHKHQGAEREVVIFDPVNAAINWSASEIQMLLNVAISRARRHFVLVASRAEIQTPILGQLVRLLTPAEMSVPVFNANGQQELLVSKKGEDLKIEEVRPGAETSPAPAGTLGEEIDRTVKAIIPSEQQTRIIERNFGEGHYLVRGVAGSGKSLILANWAVRTLQKKPDARILVTYFNKGMKNLLEQMLADAQKRYWLPAGKLNQVIVKHVSTLRDNDGKFDSAFVDEAQDLTAMQLLRVYSMCQPVSVNDTVTRNFVMFYDDSQNIYGRSPLEEFRQQLANNPIAIQRDLAKALSFQGRSFVLKEAYRSTQEILGFAINMALDPHNFYSQTQPGLLEFFKVAELAKEELLIRPGNSEKGIYEIRYTERNGGAPEILKSRNNVAVFSDVAKEIKRLTEEEKVSPGSIMVVSVKQPNRIVDELKKIGVKAVAYGGARGQNPINMPASRPDHVRCTTVFSCKGHEAPIVMIADVEEFEDLRFMNQNLGNQRPPYSDVELKRIERCMLYVAMSRAMVRLYVFGTQSKLLNAALEYSKLIGACPVRMVS